MASAFYGLSPLMVALTIEILSASSPCVLGSLGRTETTQCQTSFNDECSGTPFYQKASLQPSEPQYWQSYCQSVPVQGSRQWKALLGTSIPRHPGICAPSPLSALLSAEPLFLGKLGRGVNRWESHCLVLCLWIREMFSFYSLFRDN